MRTPSRAVFYVSAFFIAFLLLSCEGDMGMLGFDFDGDTDSGANICQNDNDCRENQRCLDGVCITTGTEDECIKNEDCNDGEICLDGVCVDSGALTPCDEDLDCPNGLSCIDGYCRVEIGGDKDSDSDSDGDNDSDFDEDRDSDGDTEEDSIECCGSWSLEVAHQVDFGPVVLGSSRTEKLLITSIGDETVTIYSFELVQDERLDFSLIEAPESIIELEPGEQFELNIQVVPSVPGIREATLIINSNDGDEPEIHVALLTQYIGQARIIVEPDEVDFGRVPLDGEYQSAGMTISNEPLNPDWNKVLTINGIRFESGGTPDFALPLEGVVFPLIIPPGTSNAFNFEVIYQPTSVEEHLETLIIEVGEAEPQNYEVEVPLRGEGVVPDLQASPDSGVHFGIVSVNDFAVRYVKLTNIGGAPLYIEDVLLVEPADTSFMLDTQNAVGAELEQGQFEEVKLTYSPTSAGSNAAVLRILTNDYETPSVDIPVDGVSIESDLRVSPPYIEFSDVLVGAKNEVIVKVRNGGQVTLTLNSVDFGPGTGDFALENSEVLPIILQPNDYDYLTFSYAPGEIGNDSGFAYMRVLGGIGDYALSLSGRGVRPELLLQPSGDSIDLGQVVINSSRTVSFTFTNGGSAPLTISGIELDEEGPQYFELLPADNFTLGAGESESIDISFAPDETASPGEYQQTFSFISDDPAHQHVEIALSAEAIDPQLELDPPDNPFDFGGVDLGIAAEHVFVASNAGSGPLEINWLQLTASSRLNGFSVDFSGGQPPVVIEARANYAFTVRFAPASEASVNGELDIFSNDYRYPNAYGLLLAGQGQSCPQNQHFCQELGCVASDSVTHCGSSCEACPQPDNSQAICPFEPVSKSFYCDFTCNGGFVKLDGECVEQGDPNQCGPSHVICPDAPQHGVSACVNDECMLLCEEGYHLCGEYCYANGDITHCGEACLNCPDPANGDAYCIFGECTTMCNSGLHACDDGNCYLANDTKHCGADCRTCIAPPGGSVACIDDECVPSCPEGYHACGGECLSDDSTLHCGSNCYPCPTPPHSQAACALDSLSGLHYCDFECNFGYVKVNGECRLPENPDCCGESCMSCLGPTSNGEAVCIGGMCDIYCYDGYHACDDGVCHSDSDTSSCGDACISCPATQNGQSYCVGGRCVAQCDDNYHDCGDGVCRSDSDPEFCGPFCMECPTPEGGEVQCIGGECVPVCEEGAHFCNGNCVDSSSPATCGDNCVPCTPPANADALCLQHPELGLFACDFECREGFVEIDGQCLEPGNTSCCGDTCTVCEQPPEHGVAACIDGTCVLSCVSGYHECDGACLSDTDADYCGIDCIACPAPDNGAAYCLGGRCFNRCDGNYHLCGDTCVSNDDPSQCGPSCFACEAPVGGTAVCANDQCQGYCPTDKHLCDDTCFSNSSVQHCGQNCFACPQPSNSAAVCLADSQTGQYYCDFTCKPGYVKHEGECRQTGNVNCCGDECLKCPTAPAHGQAACIDELCVVLCLNGYHVCGDGLCYSDSDIDNCGTDCVDCPTEDNSQTYCIGGECRYQCNTGYHGCPDGLCYPNSDVDNCGPLCLECLPPSGGDSACVNNQCVKLCEEGSHLCGSECRLNDQAASCGGNCYPCPQPPHSASICVMEPDSGDYYCDFECEADYVRLGNECVESGNVNCCGDECVKCPQAPANGVMGCVAGECVTACVTGYHNCGGLCFADNDPSFCGLSCTNCPTSDNGETYCIGGDCRTVCAGGFHLCGDVCRADDDPEYCGATCIQCEDPQGGSTNCVAGVCTPGCESGEHLCDIGGGTLGCFTNDDIGHCGASCAACPVPENGTAACVNGQCIPSCLDSYHACSDGLCYADDDPGACGILCMNCPAVSNGAPTCNEGQCGTDCAPNYHICGDGRCYADSDAGHCGENCTQCFVPNNGSAACESGQCSESCFPNYHQCHGEGHCFPNSDTAHCGDSCVTCSTPEGAVSYCLNGTCIIDCAVNYHVCGDGLCYRDNDTTHCGEDCTTCVAPENGYTQCVGGACQNMCNASYHFCPGDDTACFSNTDIEHCGPNCEVCTAPPGGTASCVNNMCVKVCPNGTHICPDGGCYGDSDIDHCGAACIDCPEPQNGTAYCSGGQCNPVCNTGYHACGDGDCYMNNDITHCGSACENCQVPVNGYALCDGSCNALCFQGDHICPDGSCQPVNSPDHCGTDCTVCERPDNGSAICLGGSCQMTCPSDRHLCNDPVNGWGCFLNSDSSHCGSACLACDAPNSGNAACVNGQCEMQCPAGLHLCDDPTNGPTCFLNTDPDHCGELCSNCEAPASGTAACVNGQCEMRCGTNAHLCDDPTDGWKCYTASDATHCGEDCIACEIPADGQALCVNGLCQKQCPANWHMCDPYDGACYSNTDINNCGTACAECEVRRPSQNPIEIFSENESPKM